MSEEFSVIRMTSWSGLEELLGGRPFWKGWVVGSPLLCSYRGALVICSSGPSLFKLDKASVLWADLEARGKQPFAISSSEQMIFLSHGIWMCYEASLPFIWFRPVFAPLPVWLTCFWIWLGTQTCHSCSLEGGLAHRTLGRTAVSTFNIFPRWPTETKPSSPMPSSPNMSCSSHHLSLYNRTHHKQL